MKSKTIDNIVKALDNLNVKDGFVMDGNDTWIKKEQVREWLPVVLTSFLTELVEEVEATKDTAPTPKHLNSYKEGYAGGYINGLSEGLKLIRSRLLPKE